EEEGEEADAVDDDRSASREAEPERCRLVTLGGEEERRAEGDHHEHEEGAEYGPERACPDAGVRPKRHECDEEERDPQDHEGSPPPVCECRVIGHGVRRTDEEGSEEDREEEETVDHGEKIGGGEAGWKRG